MLAKPTLDMSRFADRMAGFAQAGSLLRDTLAKRPNYRIPNVAAGWKSDGAGMSGKAFDPVGASPALRDVLGRLAALQPNGPLCGMTMPVGPTPAIVVPDGARFEEFIFRGSGGTLGYKLYVPASAAGQDRPLVVMLHGCTQSPDDFAAGTRHEHDRGGTRHARRLSAADLIRQCSEVLELVRSQGPATRLRRAGAHRRTDARDPA